MQKLELFHCPSLDQLSKPGESERDFRIRLQQAAREARDRQADELKKKYAPKLAALGERKRKAEQASTGRRGRRSSRRCNRGLGGDRAARRIPGRKTLSMATLKQSRDRSAGSRPATARKRAT